MAGKLKLDFERPIAELEAKLRELSELSVSNNMDVSEEVDILRHKLEKTKREIYAKLTPWQRVQLARHPDRPYTMDYIKRIFTDFIELSGDRRFAEDRAIVGGFAKIDGAPVMVVGTQKGRDTKENVMRNFGCPHPEGYRKALRLMQLAEKSKVPVITIIDTPGAFPGIASEERHIGEAIAVNLREMFGLSVPIIATVIGEGGSGGALGIGVGDRILLMENAYYSVITPEGCAAILWKDRAFAPKAAESLRLSAKDLQELNIVDEIVSEPVGGGHADPDAAAAMLKKAWLKNLKQLGKLPVDQLLQERYAKYRRIGAFEEGAATEVEAVC